MTAIWWIRRDLRIKDNPALHRALQHGSVIPLYILDPVLIKTVSDRRKAFLFRGLHSLDRDLRAAGSRLIVKSGKPLEVLKEVARNWKPEVIAAEEDFTPYALQRDQTIQNYLPLQPVQGQLVHHPMAIRSKSGKPYRVYTPFSKAWKALLPSSLAPLPAPESIPFPEIPIQTDELPEAVENTLFPAGEAEALARLKHFTEKGSTPPVYSYAQDRNRMDLDGTSSLSPYFHFGMLSMRTAAAAAMQAAGAASSGEERKGPQTWLNELIWREFYISILFQHPRVLQGNFRQQYDSIAWRKADEEFNAWKEGRTGYPVVDAAMRQLSETGWMHNRARMLTASFLVKDLLIDWRRGEAWFEKNLLDADLAANNGGWQWTAGVGTDAAPYFRIFNPILQGKKFDPAGEYVRRWIPELAHLPTGLIHTPWKADPFPPSYPDRIVDHSFARERTLQAFSAAKEA